VDTRAAARASRPGEQAERRITAEKADKHREADKPKVVFLGDAPIDAQHAEIIWRQDEYFLNRRRKIS